VTEPKPIVCTLSENDLRGRLEQITALGADALIAHEEANGIHTLRFRDDEHTRHQLEQIVDAEASCCSFLDLTIDERDGELILAVDAPTEGRSVADEFAKAFSATR
jgi:hypothetical protein